MPPEYLKESKIYNFLGYVQLPLFFVGLITFLFSYYRTFSNTGSYLYEPSYLFLHIIAVVVAVIYSFRSTSRLKDLLTVGVLLVILKIPFFWALFEPSPFHGLLAFFHKLVTFGGGSIEAFFLSIVGAKIYQKMPLHGTLAIIIILLPINTLLVYANIKDTTLKYTLSGKVNSVFESIEGCDDFFSPVRVSECKVEHINHYERSK